jgi:four helix bundle protein
MARIASFWQLIVWQKAMDLAETCHAVAREFPRSEEFVLSAQLRRSAVSVPSNIAEGHRLSTNAFQNYLRTALASEAEIETQLELGGRLGFARRGTGEAATGQAEEVARLLWGLSSSLRR